MTKKENINEQIKEWYELTQKIKGVAIRSKDRDLLDDIAYQVKEDFLMFEGEINEFE